MGGATVPNTAGGAADWTVERVAYSGGSKFTLECSPGVHELASDLTDPARAESKLAGRLLRRQPCRQILGKPSLLPGQAGEPIADVDAGRRRFSRTGTPILKQHFSPFTFVGVSFWPVRYFRSRWPLQ